MLEPILVVIVMIGALGWAAVVAVRAPRHAPSGPEREVVDHTGDARPLASIVVFVGDDIGRVSGSIGLGSLTVLTGSFALMWITAAPAAETPSTSVFLLVPVGLLIGSLVFVLATIRPSGASATTSSE